MKATKKLALVLMAFAIMLTTAILLPADAKAATVESPKSAAHIGYGNYYTYGSSNIIFEEGDYKITKLEASKGLYARITYTRSHSDVYEEDIYPYGYATISYYTKKAGNYKVTFDVINKSGEVTTQHTIKVVADNNSNAIKKATFAGKINQWYSLTTKKKAVVKFTANKGYTINKIECITYDKDGKEVVKTMRNGGTATLGQYRYGYNSSYTGNEYWFKDLFARTLFRVYYTDKITGLQEYTTYSVYRIPKLV